MEEQFKYAKENYRFWTPSREEMDRITKSDDSALAQNAARPFYEEGLRFFKEQEYLGAITHFEKANELYLDGYSSHYLSVSLCETGSYVRALQESVTSLSFAETGGYGNGTRNLPDVYYTRGLAMFLLLRESGQLDSKNEDLIAFAKENLEKSAHLGQKKAQMIIDQLSLDNGMK